MPKQQKSSFRSSRTLCCVVGCHNSYANTNNSVQFYTFPNRAYELERRNIWIRSVRRTNKDGTPWIPKKWDVICSKHFINNKKSSEAFNPSYNPVIFPAIYKRRLNENITNERHQRLQKRLHLKGQVTAMQQSEVVTVNETFNYNDTDNIKTQSVEIQVCLSNDDKEFAWDCCFLNENAKSTFCNIIALNKICSKKSIDKAVGNEEELKCDGFHGISSIDVNSDEKWSSLTGLNFERFNFVLGLVTQNQPNEKISVQNKLLLSLMKLKLGLSFTALSVLFGLHRTSVSRIFFKLLAQIVTAYKNFVYWPTREVVDGLMPDSFKRNFPKCRVIIDCSEVTIEHPHSVDNRIFTYSQYKGAHTAKFLLAVNPHGFITFISKCYGGRSTDPFIVNDCGFLDLLEADDLILADKGFPGIKCDNNSIIVMPPFVHNGILTPEEVERGYTVASVRIHVERCIQRIKNFYIFRLLTVNLFPHIDDIVRVCAMLTNLQEPIIKVEL